MGQFVAVGYSCVRTSAWCLLDTMTAACTGHQAHSQPQGLLPQYAFLTLACALQERASKSGCPFCKQQSHCWRAPLGPIFTQLA